MEYCWCSVLIRRYWAARNRGEESGLGIWRGIQRYIKSG
jgi:hypothetical protein